MVGIVVVTHGPLAKALLATAELIVGEIPGAAPVGLEPGDGPELAREKVERAIAEVESGQGSLLLVDLPGGTPCTVCMSCLGGSKVEVISGVNLSMLVKVPFIRSMDGRPLDETARQLASYGTKAVRVITPEGCAIPGGEK